MFQETCSLPWPRGHLTGWCLWSRCKCVRGVVSFSHTLINANTTCSSPQVCHKLPIRHLFSFVLLSREFQTPFLLCDCNLLWLLRWVKDRSVAVKSTKCSYPQSLQGQLVTSLRPELLTCGRNDKKHHYAHRLVTAQRCRPESAHL